MQGLPAKVGFWVSYISLPVKEALTKTPTITRDVKLQLAV